MKVQFRAWDKGNKIWQTFTIKELVKTDKVFLPFLDKWCQYTDTHDKNGQRVCEGDIVHVSRQIIHIDPEFKNDWDTGDEQQRAYMLEHNLVMMADYEEIGIVKKNPTRWALSPYVAKTVSFEHSQVNEKWIEASKSRSLRVNRGLWVVEVIGNVYDTPELYTEALKNT